MKKTFVVILGFMIAACATTVVQSTKEGLVEFAGAQKNIFATGKAEQMLTVATMAASADSFGVGAVAGLDGEITVYQGKPYITKVRGDSFTLDHGTNHGAVFAVWTQQSKWREEPVTPEVKGYLDLQNFIKARAAAAGIDVAKPFPFLLSGTPAEVKWHINVDLTEGKPITPELFAKSKANYVARNQPMDIVGFYSENHPGVFISAYAPAIKADSGVKNAIHIHIVSRDGKAAGHIDDITLAPGTTLRLPQT
jgi:alpha-acetolactate decarboxylase